MTNVPLTVGIIVGFVALIGVAIYLSILADRKRTEEMKKLADALGFGFEPEGDSTFLGELSALPLVQAGSSRTMKNLIRGRAKSVDVALFDFRYTTGSGKNRTTRHQTVVCLRPEDVSVPAFTLAPEDIWHKIGSAFGYQDIDFDTHPKFSSNFLLRGSDEDAIRECFTDAVLTYYEDRTGLCTQSSGRSVIFYRSNHTIGVDKIPAALEEAVTALALMTAR